MPAPSLAGDALLFDPADPFFSVSAVVVVYNGAKFLRATLESILAQTVPPLEILVIDDGSPDNSGEIAASLGPAITVLRIANGGASAARNFGAAQARGRWIAFCDQDDLWHPDKLRRQLNLVARCPEIHYVLTDFVDTTDGVPAPRTHLSYAPPDFWHGDRLPEGLIVRDSVLGKLTTFQPSITSTPLVLKDYFFRTGGFDPTVEWGAEDTCFHFRCLAATPFGVVPDVLMHYTRHPDAGSADPVKQLRKTVACWDYILATYPEAQPVRSDLLHGLDALRKELAGSERYATRQRWKRRLGLG